MKIGRFSMTPAASISETKPVPTVLVVDDTPEDRRVVGAD